MTCGQFHARFMTVAAPQLVIGVSGPTAYRHFPRPGKSVPANGTDGIPLQPVNGETAFQPAGVDPAPRSADAGPRSRCSCGFMTRSRSDHGLITGPVL